MNSITIKDAVLLDGGQSVASAREKIERSGLTLVAVRRTEGLIVFWYAFDAAYVLNRIAENDDHTSIKVALDLHEYQASPVHDLSRKSSFDLEKTDVVIMNNGKFIGIQPALMIAVKIDLLHPSINIKNEFSLDNIDFEEEDVDDSKLNFQISTPRPDSGAVDRVVINPDFGVSHEIKVSTFGSERTASANPDINAARISRTKPRLGARPSIRVRTVDAEHKVKVKPDNKRSATKPTVVTRPFTAYPKLEAPDQISSREAFTVVIGLASKPQENTIGGPINIEISRNIEKFILDLMVIADGFEMPKGCRFELEVERAHVEAQFISVPLIAPEVIEDALLTTISVVYFFEKLPCGTAGRKISVAPVGKGILSNPFNNGVLWTDNNNPGGTVNILPGLDPIDLTVIISKPDGNPTVGQFLWSFQSPHSVSLPELPVPCNLGTDTKDFGTHIIEEVQNSEAQGLVELGIEGLGKNIAEKMPDVFWLLLRKVTVAVHTVTPNRTPTVLFLTAEAHVPWELALIDKPIDPNAPPYLGCQVDMARWPLNDSGNPALPPSASIDVHQIAVVIGDYAARSGWRELKKAEEEGNAIVAQFDGIQLGATAPEIKQLLYARLQKSGMVTGAEAVHFACHGEAVGGHPLDAAIILGNGQHMSPIWLTSSRLGMQYCPFLFLNACQVGKAGELLGSFSGFAGESLKGGFRGFLAPLWSVDDGIAHDIALEFYDRAFGTNGNPPQTVASALRELRRSFAPGLGRVSATSFAYVFYGHPSLTLHRK